jgi:hypothetical protein
MIVTQYKRTPVAPTVALLLPDATVVDEHGAVLEFDAWPEGTRCWGSYDTVRALINSGMGEAVCWNGEEIHWRRNVIDEPGWTSAPSDVHVLKLPLDDDQHALSILALTRWRDWLAEYGAAPTGTTGSAAWSLLRATLEGELRTSEPFAAAPPLRSTVGGRQELGPHGQGSYTGRLEQLDLPAAYASTLGMLPYGGRWYRTDDLLPEGVSRDPDWWAAENRPCFVRCVVEVPELAYGPLPKRPLSRRDAMQTLGLGCEYPVGRRVQGLWSWQEVQQAEAHGCRVVKVLEVYGHFAGGRLPFAPWWEAVQAGRSMHGLAGLLAKMTGNALWGRFCADSRFGRRTIRSLRGAKLVSRPLVFRGGQPPAHDLAETVSGRVRARLYGAMMEVGDRLVSAHTDGLWVEGGLEIDGWRLKQEASRLDLLGPQCLRYWPVPARADAPWVVFAGQPSRLAGEVFEQAWERCTDKKEAA